MSTLSPTTILESAARPNVMPKSRRMMAPRAEKPIRVSPCNPVGSTPRNSTSNSTGRVTALIVRSPVSTHAPFSWRRPVLAKVIVGECPVSKKSPERRWLSRISLPVLTDESATAAVAEQRAGSGPVTILPLTWLNVPRTLLIRCRAAKATTVCAGSIVQVPAVQPASADGSALLTLAAPLMSPPCFPPSPRVAGVPSRRTCSRSITCRAMATSPGSPVTAFLLGVVSRQPSPRAPDAVSQVHHAGAFERPDQFEFDVAGAKRVEQTSPSAEQDRHEVDLHLVE